MRSFDTGTSACRFGGVETGIWFTVFGLETSARDAILNCAAKPSCVITNTQLIPPESKCSLPNPMSPCSKLPRTLRTFPRIEAPKATCAYGSYILKDKEGSRNHGL